MPSHSAIQLPAETAVLCLLTAAPFAVFAEQTCASLRVQSNEDLFDRVEVAGVEMLRGCVSA